MKNIVEKVDAEVLNAVGHVIYGYNWLTGGDKYDLAGSAMFVALIPDLLAKKKNYVIADLGLGAMCYMLSRMHRSFDKKIEGEDVKDLAGEQARSMHKMAGYVGSVGGTFVSVVSGIYGMDTPFLSPYGWALLSLASFAMSLDTHVPRRQSVVSRRLKELLKRGTLEEAVRVSPSFV